MTDALPDGFRKGHDDSIACPHRDVSCCPACLAADARLVDVDGAVYFLPDPLKRAMVLGEQAELLIGHLAAVSKRLDERPKLGRAVKFDDRDRKYSVREAIAASSTPSGPIDWPYRGNGPGVSCEIDVIGSAQHGFEVTCTAHHCESELRGDLTTEAEARAAFVCDLGRMWRFIVHHFNDSPGPQMFDLSGLQVELRRFVQSDQVGPGVTPHGDPDSVSLLLYADGSLRQLEFDYTEIGPDTFRCTVADANSPFEPLYLEFEMELQ